MDGAKTSLDDGPLHIDFVRGEVTINGKHVDLTSKQYDLLTTLVKKRGEPLPYHRIAQLAWDDPTEPTTTASEYSIIRLRRNLGWDDGVEGSPFEHVAGVGYQSRSADP